jgi:hypothetical protein
MQISVEDKSINIYLDELAVKPDEFGNEKLTSNGFHTPQYRTFHFAVRLCFYMLGDEDGWLILPESC